VANAKLKAIKVTKVATAVGTQASGAVAAAPSPIVDLNALELCKTWDFSGNFASNRFYLVKKIHFRAAEVI
jgi:hypothetical protein